jgi:hypothetical protein
VDRYSDRRHLLDAGSFERDRSCGTIVTLTDSAPTTDRWNFASIEIIVK